MSEKKDCGDARCPVHGSLKIRGKVLTGRVKSAKMRRSVTIQIERRNYLKKYDRYENRLTNIKAHNPDCIAAKEGDIVKVSECRPLSKTKKFVVMEKVQ
ncbi:MAG: 30S ribosomal protein S17 [Candidatus Woesearchaeota archaeon]